MEQGFIRAAAGTPKIQVADPEYNAGQILTMMEQGAKQRAKIMVFPELCLTGYTCGDLFLQDSLLECAKRQLARIVKESAHFDMIAFLGLPFQHQGKLYNTAAVAAGGKLLGLVPKQNIPN